MTSSGFPVRDQGFRICEGCWIRLRNGIWKPLTMQLQAKFSQEFLPRLSNWGTSNNHTYWLSTTWCLCICIHPRKVNSGSLMCVLLPADLMVVRSLEAMLLEMTFQATLPIVSAPPTDYGPPATRGCVSSVCWSSQEHLLWWMRELELRPYAPPEVSPFIARCNCSPHFINSLILRLFVSNIKRVIELIIYALWCATWCLEISRTLEW